jgi:hypothetical protein
VDFPNIRIANVWVEFWLPPVKYLFQSKLQERGVFSYVYNFVFKCHVGLAIRQLAVNSRA